MTKMKQSSVRKALLTDAAALAELSGQLGYPSESADMLARLQVLLPNAEDQVWVAELDGQVVGWLHAFVAHRLESDAFVEIAGLVVDQGVRGSGMGAQLVGAAVEWAARLGFAQVRVRSNVTREATHRFYERLGFAKSKTQSVFALAVDIG